MKILKIFLALFFAIRLAAQTCSTVIAYDNIETSTWAGAWFGSILTEGYYNNASVSATNSAALYGNGAGSSAIEQDWYVLPNITGLNSAYTYQFKMRLGSYTFSNSTAGTRGVDSPDLVEIQISTNGEISYTSEIRITGNGNATWDYNSAAITKTASGTLTTYSPTAGGNRSATGDGYSDITLTLTGITQLAVDILCRVNANGEEWWLDNMQLIEIAPCATLPISLVLFQAEVKPGGNLVKWRTQSEKNNDRFVLESSHDAIEWWRIAQIKGYGDSFSPVDYQWFDLFASDSSLNYYRLTQIDFDGVFNSYGPIFADRRRPVWATLVRCIDPLGREVGPEYVGLVIEFYSDGSSRKVILTR
jgi:hypothetical protein